MLTLAAVTLMFGTLHLNGDLSRSHEYRDTNPGLMLHVEATESTSLVVGQYANSIYRTSRFAGLQYSLHRGDMVEMSVIGGGITGYGKNITPFAAPAVGVRVTPSLTLNAMYLPSPAMVGMKSGAQGVNFSATYRF